MLRLLLNISQTAMICDSALNPPVKVKLLSVALSFMSICYGEEITGCHAVRCCNTPQPCHDRIQLVQVAGRFSDSLGTTVMSPLAEFHYLVS